MKIYEKIIAYICVLSITVSTFSYCSVARAESLFDWMVEAWKDHITNDSWASELPSLSFSLWENGPSATLGGLKYASLKPQSYYTTPTQSVEDKYGNVTNYYRGGDTTTTSIIDSYNKTFNTIHNTTNNTNNYQANVKLSDFLNSYTTNNNNYTYSTQLNSWYYDNTQNTLNYSNNYTYYNTDNSKYYISIDNSKDEYYLVDVQYSPTFVTVNYTYNTTNNIDNSTTINNNVGDVTNVYYFELKDGRNSSELTASEVAGLDLGYDVVNYDLIPDDPNTLSLQHFDGNYNDSSTYNREFYSVNRSTTYGDAGDFGGAVQLVSGAVAGVKIPDLSSYDGLQFDFRIRYSDAAALKIYLGDSCIYDEIHRYKQWEAEECYSDNRTEKTVPFGSSPPAESTVITISYTIGVPKSFSSSGGELYSYSPMRYGYEIFSGIPSFYDYGVTYNNWEWQNSDPDYTVTYYRLSHYRIAIVNE